ncbi:F-box/LRR-repeat protein At4g14103-like [Triticum aestivum]|uniref:F-box/LRR-repeat protein At4g14103-like n=1 Tax=Triticum aestivum TaxID=4565 RepID=UPI001D01E95B|nr:F-box/LRR-repeat protein At4g14103-like [Triticum aestivum]
MYWKPCTSTVYTEERDPIRFSTWRPRSDPIEVVGHREFLRASEIMGSPLSRRDRISALPDSVLGDILSHLPTVEAGRAAALGRRWRHIFGHVHTVWYDEEEGERSTDWESHYFEAKEYKSCSHALLDGISAALLCRLRCAGRHVPLRTFCFAFDDFRPGWDTLHVDEWFSYVLQYAGHDLHLDLRFVIGPICTSDNRTSFTGTDDSDDHEEGPYGRKLPYLLPTRIFSCATLKTLSLTHCRLKLSHGASVHLPALETLRLTSIHHDSGKSIQRLVLGCPRLLDLTLEAIHRLRTFFLLHTRLRRFALTCCHNIKSIHIDATEMASLEYRGDMHSESLLNFDGSPPRGIPSCIIDLCTSASKSAKDHDLFRRFLWSFSASKCLHLHHGGLHTMCLAPADKLPPFTWMTRLVLQGRVESRAFVAIVHDILQHAPNLEVLSFYMAEKKQRRMTTARR